MKKNIIKKIIVTTLAATMMISVSITAFAATAQDITTKNPTNYTIGMQSVYSSKLTQDQLNAVANKWIDSTYSVGSDGAMLTNVQKTQKTQKTQKNKKKKDIRCWNTNAKLPMNIHAEGYPTYYPEEHSGKCYIVDSRVNSFSFSKVDTNVNPSGHEVWVYGVTEYNGTGFALGEPKVYPLKYNKTYSLDFTGTHRTAAALSRYCKDNDITIIVDVVDRKKVGINGESSRAWNIRYATKSSIPTGKIGE